MSYLAEGMLDTVSQKKFEPLLGKLKPLVKTNEPHLGKQKPLKGTNKPLLKRMIEPLQTSEEPVKGTRREVVHFVTDKTPLLDGSSVKAVASYKQSYLANVYFRDTFHANPKETPKRVYTCRATLREICKHSNFKVDFHCSVFSYARKKNRT